MFQNRTNFCNNIPTCDIRLFMKSFLNKLSQNRRNLGAFYDFILSFWGLDFCK
ncbi:hypothetical protein OROMI_016599 [Orobanche minor]